ncbi:hypothetical protein [Streptomyces sp. NRRL S-146]|uniref:hypothetical protein n=1 Tax=Streptomyces sp. NRRL S-146 TaxID=1463884 RepID=UPI00068D75D3|nr:hypothetical protein [Streptomyces sp. NRRL S-146]
MAVDGAEAVARGVAAADVDLDGRGTDPGGALAFASLLLLADREEGAQFWLQFAAGGQATGAICLYLMHLRRGEWRDAKYRARQIEALEGEPCQYAPVPHEVGDARGRCDRR